MTQHRMHGAQPDDAEEVAGLDLFSTAEEAETPARGRKKAALIFLAAAVVVIVLVVVVIVNLVKGSGNPADNASKSVATQVRHAKDAKTLSDEAGDGTFSVTYSAKVNAFAVNLKDVAAAPKDEEYQISVTHTDSAQSFERVGLLGRKPSGWAGYRGVKSVASVHVTIVAQGGEDAPEQADLAEIKLKK
jgi:flagellar basal body-associated protein FliL